MLANVRSPRPLDELELSLAQEAVMDWLQSTISLANIEASRSGSGHYDAETQEMLMDLMGTWNALEAHLAYLQRRPQKNLVGDELPV